MASFLEYITRLVDAIYSSPNPQVKTYFRDLRVVNPMVEEDSDEHYLYQPEPNQSMPVSAVGAAPASPRLTLSKKSAVASSK